MPDLTLDSEPLSRFRRQSSAFAKLLKKTRHPLVLTVKGKPAFVLQTPESYQRLLDLAARQDAREGIRQGLEDAKKGRTRPAREAFASFETARRIPG